ncbi:MAG TPA: hypothetical protein VJ757_09675 [Pseudonocardiaceae bacterium]|nr:hypothetical protein [Pseudonocardiaceae bacterium]
MAYRGYDSGRLPLPAAGGKQLGIRRAAGRLAALREALPDDGTDCWIGIHNGTIDNAPALRTQRAATGTPCGPMWTPKSSPTSS